MKKVIIILFIAVVCLGGYFYYDNKVKNQQIEEFDTSKMQEMPKIVYEAVEKYAKENSISNIGRNEGILDIKTIDMGNNTFLNENSYYYISGSSIYLYVEYIYKDNNDKYICKMTISSNKDNVKGFSYEKIIDK